MTNDGQASLFPDNDTTETLAADLNMPIEKFVETFGAGWRPLPDTGVNLDSDPTGTGWFFGQWYIAGDPVQLMLRVRTDQDIVEVAAPRGILIGHGDVVFQPGEPHDIRRGPNLQDVAPGVVNDCLKRRRSTFRYCRYCRRLTPPEERLANDVCYGCGTTWQGVIY